MKPTTLLPAGAGLLLPCLLSIACGLTRHAPAIADEPLPVRTTGDLPGDSAIEAALAMIDPRIRSAGTERRLAFDLRNETDRPQRGLLGIDWFDRDGRRVAEVSRMWLPVRLEPRESRRLEITVPVPEAVSWRWRAVQNLP